MSSPHSETTVRSDDPAEQPKRAKLSAVQVAASALAAVSSAVVASFFGMAGTLIGAALASVIATVGTTLYTESLRKTNEGLKRVLITRQPAAPTAKEPVAASRALPPRLDPRRPPDTLRGPRWSRVGVYAVAVFVVAMGIVTGIELIGQKPVSALVGNSHSSGTTTIDALTNASSHRDTTPSTPSSPAPSSPASSSPASSSPATSAPAATTGRSSPSKATATGDQGARSSSTSSSESAPSAPRSSATPTPAPGRSPAPAQGTAPTP
jgi:hypothetical protein